MTEDRADRIASLFAAARRLAPQDRARYLAEACRDEPALRAEIEALLAEEAPEGGLLGAAWTDGAPPTATLDSDADDQHEQIGRYRLISLIGRGGMGEVWLAEQREPIRRRVALKLIKSGMDTKDVLARFDVERQALAIMDHPYVAKVLDAGETNTGRPYFVMEYVEGVPITEYCDRHRLTNIERLRLFMRVCEGVQHAHHKAIIHRDVKPSNVLVVVRDGVAVPKIIDFGVAKAVGHRLTEKTLLTEHGRLIGTPEYMSPEQAEMTNQDIDTRTDVYSLGVLLYELLSGVWPLDLERSAIEEMLRRIREDEPVRPSSRLDSLNPDDSTNTARRRRTDPRSLVRQLRGDLDWIVLRALEKDRVRRYRSPAELAEDAGRYLANEPVRASPPSAAYRARKFLRRHRVGAGVAAVTMLVVLLFAVTMTVQARRIASERDRANREAGTKDYVLGFLKDVFTISDPSEARGSSVTARELLDRAAEKLDTVSVQQPETQAELMATLGYVYRNLGLLSPAGSLLERALSTRSDLFGREHPETLRSMHDLAILRDEQGQFDEAESLLLEAVKVRTRVLGADHPDTLSSKNSLGVIYWRKGRFDDAERLYLEVLEARKRTLGDDHPSTLSFMGNLAILYDDQGRYDQAEQLFRQVLEGRKRVLGVDHPDTLNSMDSLGIVYWRQGRYDEAEALYAATLEGRRRILGEDHPRTLESLQNLGNLLIRQGRYDEAEPLLLEAVETRRRVLGTDHPSTLSAVESLAYLYREQGRYSEAEPLFLENVAARTRLLGHDHPRTLSSMSNLAILYDNQRRYDEAEQLYSETLRTQEKVLGVDHPDTQYAKSNLAILYANQKRYNEAETLLRDTLETRKRVLGDDHPETLDSLHNLAELYATQGLYGRSEPLYREALEARRRVLGDEHPSTLMSMRGLANLYLDQGRYEEAQPLYLETLAGRKKVLGDSHPDTSMSLYDLACLSAVRGDLKGGMEWLRQSIGAGFADVELVLEEPKLESLHGPQFDRLVARIRENASK